MDYVKAKKKYQEFDKFIEEEFSTLDELPDVKWFQYPTDEAFPVQQKMIVKGFVNAAKLDRLVRRGVGNKYFRNQLGAEIALIRKIMKNRHESLKGLICLLTK